MVVALVFAYIRHSMTHVKHSGIFKRIKRHDHCRKACQHFHTYKVSTIMYDKYIEKDNYVNQNVINKPVPMLVCNTVCINVGQHYTVHLQL